MPNYNSTQTTLARLFDYVTIFRMVWAPAFFSIVDVFFFFLLTLARISFRSLNFLPSFCLLVALSIASRILLLFRSCYRGIAPPTSSPIMKPCTFLMLLTKRKHKHTYSQAIYLMTLENVLFSKLLLSFPF